MRGTPERIAAVLLALTICAALSGAAAGIAPHDTVTNTTDSTPTPTPTDSGSVTDTVDDTTDSTVNSTTDTVDSTTDSVTDTTDSTTDSTTDTVDSTTDTTDSTTDSTTDTVDSTTDTVDDTTDTTEPTDSTEELLDGTDTTDGTTDTTLNQLTEDTTRSLASSLERTENTTDTLVDEVNGSLSTTTSSLTDLDTLDDGSLLEADDDTTFTVSGTVETDTTAEFESYGGSDADALEPADSSPDSSTAPAMRTWTRRFPTGPGPTAAGATAAAGLGAVAAGAMLGSGSGVERQVASQVRGALDRLLRMVAPFRYSSYDGSDPLEHEDRAAIHDYVDENPGAYMSAVSEALGLNHSTARHHIKILEREGLVENAKVRGRRRLFPAYAQQQELAAALADEATADVLEAIARLGPCSGSALAEAVDKSVSTVSHHLSRLEDDGLVVREKDGRATVNKLPDEVQEALAPEHDRVAADASAVSAD